tara:strand:- start:7069 stop:8016 length:948 start_codon:yes stop_codon:yes gene_type:complete
MTNHIALFGIGYWGKNHLRELSKHNSIDKLYVVDPMIDSYSDLTSQYQDVKFFKSFEELIKKNSKINAAVIATPPHTHFEIAKNCLLNDIHILVEKPMVEKMSHLEELKSIAKDNLLLMSGHTYLYHPAILKMKEIINSGEIGKIMMIHSQRLNFGIMRENVDVFSSLAPHDISLVQYFSNDSKPESIVKDNFNFTFSPHSDYASLGIKFEDKLYAKIDVSWYYPEKVRQIKVIGEKKTLVFDDVLKTLKLLDISIDKNYNHIDKGEENISFDNGIQPLTNEINHFIEYLKCPSECITGYSHTKNVIKIIEDYHK